jgi:hypothetical protein
MALEHLRVRQNYLANIVAAVVCFLIEAVWYSLFLERWVNGIGRSVDWLNHAGVNNAVQFGTALLAEGIMATAISGFTQLTGPQTALRGMKVAAELWFGFVFTVFATEFVFEVRNYSLFAITTGFWLVGMVAMGAIVGAWKKKRD